MNSEAFKGLSLRCASHEKELSWDGTIKIFN
jgi:hypothetical protein